MTVLLDWAAYGLWHLSAWQVVLVTLAMTHITMVCVTIYLHRHQAHRALDLHPVAAHFFRFWLWLTTGQITKEWAAIHRKHHAKCETPDDPHSPQIYGIKTVLLQGYELYRKEAVNQETLKRYGHGTPDDWLERHVYSGHSFAGVLLLLLIDLALFGALGLTVWAVQMAWTPVMAAGIINGGAHYWGYRNFEVSDASTNISPWGIVIAGEELHNNHHTYPTSAKLSVKPYEFDIGWLYISALQRVGLATAKKTPPRLALGVVRPVADEQTLEALIQNRFELMAGYAKGMRRAFNDELVALKARRADVTVIRAAQRWLHRDLDKVPAAVAEHLALAREASPVLDKLVVMREELRQMWLNRSHTREQLTVDLQGWCQRAEASGIAALQEFALNLRAVRV
ncbi:MAG: acyl-CoA desaturase [Hydrogenophilaceae bacterium CG1_02_62_390]|nr:acyl-CoA desaturase [Rhodoferax sp.]OIO79644.1 MAG: acyl-CoA desaturase [Hydrogenophilaceae bacterium CG1_02_62_390]OIP23977.1 MAG: acyl-CoA desaturase [Comamonadaceae bacterium CG2_30_60_41]PIW08901.1 MAG: acyl-CoA desaturase [Comamonadaceae bacterium CG17_big_fil_post_rev_8_21_14_2_50_60_13]PIY25781.1 MAG: acyl-CoA desaturase [Comamonadaceae bacterium CG_4_10_14_3_um_filter_60_75]PJC14609.1 MAG: acyl-CoA desaturase [Comamonadaceae bacterium CG_4_9_14_0_8_um_filter_60_18]